MTDLQDGLIRTLHILTTLHRRGAETFAVQMIDHLDRKRFAPHIWLTRPAPAGEGLVPEHTPVLSNGTESPIRALRDLVWHLRTIQPHVVQCHGGRALKYAMAAKPFWRPGVYVYNKIQSVHPHLDPPVKRFFYRVLQEQVHAIVAVGEQIRLEVQQTHHPRRPRLVAINNGRDVRPFLAVTPEKTAALRRDLDLEPWHICLMQVGITLEKDPDATLRVFSELASRIPQLRLAFVGGGPLRDRLRHEANALGLGHRVHVLGVRADVPALLSAVDLVVLPSSTEGLPGVLIEAGMAGRASVAYDVGSVRDVVADGETGFVVPQGDQPALVERLAQLVRDQALRDRMGRAARTFCRREFDIELSVSRYQRLFTDLLGGIQRAHVFTEARSARS